jgi:hypothetical protein
LAADNLRKRAIGALASKRKKALPRQRNKRAVLQPPIAETENFFFTRAHVFAAQKSEGRKRRSKAATAPTEASPPMRPVQRRSRRNDTLPSV